MIKIAQLTDSHLQHSADTMYKGIYPDAHLQRCVDWVMGNGVDTVLLTGDLCHDASLATYQRLLHYLMPMAVPCYWLPGNHDDSALMAHVSNQALGNQSLGDDFDNIRLLDAGVWEMVLLNSTCQPDGVGGGSISPHQLQQLSAFLCQQQRLHATHAQRPKLIVLHHNPVLVNSRCQDDIMLGNHEDFCHIIAQYHAVKAVVFGHVHQPVEQLINGVRFLGAPATSVQFASQQPVFTVQKELGPGLRTFTLHDDGTLDTEVIYLPKIPTVVQGEHDA